MNSYTIETVLETREPGVIELFGNAPGVVHKVSGVVHLHVDKTIHLKELTVVFLCEAVVGYRSSVVSTSSDPIAIYRNQFDAISSSSSSSTEYTPGDYTFPFQLAIPSDLSTTDSTKLVSQEFIWMYHLTTNAVPANLTKGSTINSLFQKRKTIQMPLVLRKCVVEQSGRNSVRCNARRDGRSEKDGGFMAVIFVPQVVNVKQTIVPVTVQMKGSGGGKRWRVKEIQAQMIQTEKVVHNSPEAYNSMEGLRRMIPIGIQDDPMAPKKFKRPTHHSRPQASTTGNANPNINASASVGSMINTTQTKTISNLVSVKDPNQYTEGVHSSPDQDYSETFELDLTAGEKLVNASGNQSEILTSEVLPWVTISHAVRFRVLFEDAGGEKPLVVKAPVQVAYVVGRESINLASGRPVLQGQVVEGATGVDEWMYSESAPGYEYSPDGGQDGGEEDVLPGYGEDVGRSNLLDSNLRNNQQYGLSVK
ncbi:hypothetical protein EC957_007956 [Mortierella hygrophila]|uniref:Arrestin-like N-terminal domain-containing protein n=1 Tax=Mortierella hygrophila TaxID=979708 RepID=A0A9P6JYE6_9FUNG|nr:hypothetical protein EC957_007956 [Mortierella hygrophila]